ncbi:MAG: DUF262 domain-containing protein [Candidatus Methanoperedens sp.]|nr:DUF262 domain-containing protein [Candidatus Methanoperedens sp.]
MALPHFQRDYVWDKEDVIDFLDSIYKNWPTGLVIIWKTNKPGRHFGSLWNDPSDNPHPDGLVLDGQQRLTTLKILMDDGCLPLKSEHGNRENHYFYFDLDHKKFTADTERKKDIMRYIDVTDILKDKQLQGLSIKNSKIVKNLKRMLDYKFPIKSVSASDNKDAIEIFNRVNTSGKKIDRIVIAFAQIKDRYPQIAKEIIKFQKEWVGNGFDLSDRVIMNSFLVANKIKDEDYKPGTKKPDKIVEDYLKDVASKSIEKDWMRTSKRIEDSLKFLESYAGFDSDQFLTSENIIVTLCGYFEVNESYGKLTTGRKNILLKWLYRTILLGRYSYTSNFTQDLRDLNRGEKFEDVMKIPKYRLDDESEYSYEGIISVMYALGKRNNMGDYAGDRISWFNSRQNRKRIHVDHIYPRSKMIAPPISDEIETEDLHEDFGNKSFIIGSDNMSKNKKFPGELINDKDIGQWLNVGHAFLIDNDYEKMKKNPTLLKENCKKIREFIEDRHKKIIKDIKREII